MSYNTELQSNNDELQEILDTINALPEVGEDVVLQEKTVTPTKSVQEVTADAGFTGLSKVSVEEIPDEYIVPSGTLNITENGPYDVTEKAGVVVSVEAPTPTLQDKTVTPTTSKQTINADSGYDGLDTVTVNAMPTATQATPSIEVSASGLITASATQSAGYVASGTKSATKQLTTQGAQTITPSTADQTIASGKYLTGAQTIKGDANLVAGNIKKDVSIFGVTGSFEGEGGGSSGGGGVIAKTCTVTFEKYFYSDYSSGFPIYINYTAVGDGEIVNKDFMVSSDHIGTVITIENVLMGSYIYLTDLMSEGINIESSPPYSSWVEYEDPMIAFVYIGGDTIFKDSLEL